MEVLKILQGNGGLALSLPHLNPPLALLWADIKVDYQVRLLPAFSWNSLLSMCAVTSNFELIYKELNEVAKLIWGTNGMSHSPHSYVQEVAVKFTPSIHVTQCTRTESLYQHR